MDIAICCGCIEDTHLRKIVEEEGELVKCSVCGQEEDPAITVERLGQIMEPIMREHFDHGQTYKKFGENDDEWWDQQGEPLSYWVQEVLGQYFEFENEIVSSIIEAEDCWPADGDEPYWDPSSNYVQSKVRIHQYLDQWRYTLNELKHGRRFFSPSAKSLFETLFEGVEDLRSWTGSAFVPVVRHLPIGTKVYRARVCTSRALLKEIINDPLKHVGPPPPENARPGRMNAEGVVVCYGARDSRTCLAEMRPALGSEVALITLETTKRLRVLDFSRLDTARGGRALSYFQDDFTSQVERRAFLRHLHALISKPIVPGHEADYLITQTMAEYLAHVHHKPFDGVMFSSAQRAGGENIVLFADKGVLTGNPAEAFSLKYVDKSLSIMTTSSIKYQHEQLLFGTNPDGEPWVSSLEFEDFDDE